MSQPSTIVLATPTLQDLLNPVPADVEFPPSASAEDLYSTMFDEDNDDESLPISVSAVRLTSHCHTSQILSVYFLHSSYRQQVGSIHRSKISSLFMEFIEAKILRTDVVICKCLKIVAA